MEYFEAHGRRLEKVQNKQGITVGDLLEVCDRVSMQHCLCPCATREMHDLEGWMWPSFQFDGILAQDVVLSSGHCSLVRRDGLRRRSSGEGFGGVGDELRETMLWGYMSIKKGAENWDFRILTFAEFVRDNKDVTADELRKREIEHAWYIE